MAITRNAKTSILTKGDVIKSKREMIYWLTATPTTSVIVNFESLIKKSLLNFKLICLRLVT